MSLRLDSRPLHGRGQGGSGERLPQGRWMCKLGGREKQKIREEEVVEEEEEEEDRRRDEDTN